MLKRLSIIAFSQQLQHYYDLARQRCSICPLLRRCDPEINRICFDSFVEGFKKGAKTAEKEINKKFKSILLCVIWYDKFHIVLTHVFGKRSL